MSSLLSKLALFVDIKEGDILLAGKFKNKRMEVEEIGTDELGQPTVNGQKLLAVRIEKKLPEDMKSAKTKEEGLNIEKVALGLKTLSSYSRKASIAAARESELPLHSIYDTIAGATKETAKNLNATRNEINSAIKLSRSKNIYSIKSKARQIESERKMDRSHLENMDFTPNN